MRYISINIEVSGLNILSSGTEGAGCVDGHDYDVSSVPPPGESSELVGRRFCVSISSRFKEQEWLRIARLVQSCRSTSACVELQVCSRGDMSF